MTHFILKGEPVESLDMNLAAFFQWLLRATLQGSLLVCLILAIKLTLWDKLPARWHYCLWLVLLVRLSLPWAPQSRLSIYNLVPRSLPSYLASRGPAENVAGAMPQAPEPQRGTEPISAPAQGEALSRGQDAAAVASSPVIASRHNGSAAGVGRRSYAESAAGMAPWLWLAGCLVLGGYRYYRGVLSHRTINELHNVIIVPYRVLALDEVDLVLDND